jgi:hypothetical protein
MEQPGHACEVVFCGLAGIYGRHSKNAAYHLDASAFIIAEASPKVTEAGLIG